MGDPLTHFTAADDLAESEPSLGETHLALNDRVREALRAAIMAGEFQPGDRLVEGRLAERFGVSRNPVREALKSLHAEGTVSIAPRRGAFVAKMSDAELREVIELRAALEGLGARLAARRLDPAAADSLPEILRVGERAAQDHDLVALSRLNNEFHGALAAASSNRYLTDFIANLRSKTHWLFAGLTEARALDSWQEHAGIMRAVLDRDEEMAELLASRHVLNVGRDLLIGSEESPPDGAATEDSDPS